MIPHTPQNLLQQSEMGHCCKVCDMQGETQRHTHLPQDVLEADCPNLHPGHLERVLAGHREHPCHLPAPSLVPIIACLLLHGHRQLTQE